MSATSAGIYAPLLAAFALASAAVTALAAAPVGAAEPAASASTASPAEHDWRTPDPQNVLVIDTTKGRILVEMTPAAAPHHVERIRSLVRSHFYDGLSFFRVIDEFMAQTGDPQNTGQGASTLPNLEAEVTFRRGSDLPFARVDLVEGRETGLLGSLPVGGQPTDLAMLTADHRVRSFGLFCPGVAGMARAQAMNSANSQFFLMRGTQHSLDEGYTAWGRVIAGLDVVRALKVGEPPPAPADRMTSVRVLADIPPAERPHVRVIDTTSRWFGAYIQRMRADKGNAFNVCDLDLPSEVK